MTTKQRNLPQAPEDQTRKALADYTDDELRADLERRRYLPEAAMMQASMYSRMVAQAQTAAAEAMADTPAPARPHPLAVDMKRRGIRAEELGPHIF